VYQVQNHVLRKSELRIHTTSTTPNIYQCRFLISLWFRRHPSAEVTVARVLLIRQLQHIQSKRIHQNSRVAH